MTQEQLALAERQLKAMVLQQDKGLIDVALDRIKRDKLPFIIQQTGPGQWILRSSFSPGELYLNKFLTEDPPTIEMKKFAHEMSKHPYEVLVIGETGTGKDIIAHSQIGLRGGNIKVANCAGFPKELIESELFGHVRGAFTGADKEKLGLFQEAADGVMFLDEIGDLPLDAQAKLLRVLQSKCVRKVGSNKEEEITCKVVGATNKNLEKMVEDGSFRVDLYARLFALQLHIKPLRERMCDAILIAKSMKGGDAFLSQYQDEIESGVLDLKYNARSIEGYIKQFNVLGKVTKRK